MPDNPDKTCGTCRYWFTDNDTGFGGCALLLELDGVTSLDPGPYNELDNWASWYAEGTQQGDCPQWEENEGFL
jgi:hypothetical protein